MLAISCSVATALVAAPPVSHYSHDGWRLAYRHKAAAPGHEQDTPLLLVHPVGIGLASWFWARFMEEWQGGELFAPDLIGCGDGDRWEPEKRGLFLPLDWARGCEALWREHIQRPCVVVAQGGLAPVGVVLASREADNWQASRAVSGLVLTSPPTWEEMVTAVDNKELQFNYKALSSPLGGAAVGLLERRGAIRFFSDLFLFEGESDERWLDEACAECGADVRPPVLAFNAGLLCARDYAAELKGLAAPALILSGRADKRAVGRRPYAAEMRACDARTLPGANVLPWEAARETCDAVAAFARGLK